eukprot:scaffold650_cov249-Pinguiococcus_pyrenoidosus.AAC.20
MARQARQESEEPVWLDVDMVLAKTIHVCNRGLATVVDDDLPLREKLCPDEAHDQGFGIGDPAVVVRVGYDVCSAKASHQPIRLRKTESIALDLCEAWLSVQKAEQRRRHSHVHRSARGLASYRQIGLRRRLRYEAGVNAEECQMEHTNKRCWQRPEEAGDPVEEDAQAFEASKRQQVVKNLARLLLQTMQIRNARLLIGSRVEAKVVRAEAEELKFRTALLDGHAAVAKDTSAAIQLWHPLREDP